jgi:hypothetical protein
MELETKKTKINHYAIRDEILFNEDVVVSDDEDQESPTRTIKVKQKRNIEVKPTPFEMIASEFQNHNIEHQNYTFNPFYSQDSETMYVQSFYDSNNIYYRKFCPACMCMFTKKIYVLRHFVLLCELCFKNEEQII